METTPQVRRDRRRRRRMLAFLVAVMAVGSSTTAALSLALFTSSAAAAADFNTGKIEILANGSASTNLIFTTPPTGIMPGWSGTGRVVISNNGADLRYAMTSVAATTSTTNLANAMTVTITSAPGDVACPAANAVTSGNLFGIGFGSIAQGQNLGDRPLGAGASETLCFAFSLPRDTTGNEYQSSNTTVTFTFAAEQTAYN